MSVNITLLLKVCNMQSRLLKSLMQTKTLFHEYLKPCADNITISCTLKQTKKFSITKAKPSNNDKTMQNSSHNLASSINSTHKLFDDKDAEIIFDSTEKQNTINLEDLITHEEYHDPYEGINLKRGVTGVFEIEDLISLLQKDNAKNIFVASVPPELSYIDYIVIVTGKSLKHMRALATFVRKVYKLKMNKEDLVPKIEGLKSKDWIALDLGNIALHIFSSSARSLYDLETLWSVGYDYDDKSRFTDVDIMDQYNTFLNNLQPDEENYEINDEAVESDNK